MGSVPGVVDLSLEPQTDIPALRAVDPVLAACLVAGGQVAETVQTAFVGKEVSQVLEGQVSFPGRALPDRTDRAGPSDPRRSD
jgi:Cu/Ag efflux pump CusA